MSTGRLVKHNTGTETLVIWVFNRESEHRPAEPCNNGISQFDWLPSQMDNAYPYTDQ
jgi:hypothetical protein